MYVDLRIKSAFDYFNECGYSEYELTELTSEENDPLPSGMFDLVEQIVSLEVAIWITRRSKVDSTVADSLYILWNRLVMEYSDKYGQSYIKLQEFYT